MIIEKLKLEDLEQVVQLHKLIIPFALDLEVAKETCQKMMQNEDFYLLVAKEEGEVIGTVTGICCKTLATPFFVVEDMVVRETHRGKGVGRALMEELERISLENHSAYAILVSSGHRKGAHKFYEELGYTDDVRGFRKIY